MGKQKVYKDIPLVVASPLFPILREPFVFKHLDDFVFDGRLSKVKLEDMEFLAGDLLRKSRERKMAYLMYLIFLGKLLQENLQSLYQEKSVNRSELQKYIHFYDHPSFRDNNKKDYNKKEKNLPDDLYFAYLTMLDDYLIALRAHMSLFCSTYQMSILGEIPNPE